MSRRPLVAILSFSALGVLLHGWTASGQVTPPFLRYPASLNPSEAVSSQSFRKFRPVEKREEVDFDEAERVLSHKSFIENVYDKEMSRRFHDQYRSEVLPFEQKATNPYRRARSWEMEAYDQKREELAKWGAREVMNDQLKEFLRGGDKNSAPMQVINTMKEVSGGGPEDPAEKKLTPEERAVRAHRMDLPILTTADEEKIPTKLKTKLNLLRGRGQLAFYNPIVTTTLNLKAGRGDDNFVVEMNRDFRKITLNSSLRYEVDRSLMNFNLNKKITDRISLDMAHRQYTGSKRGERGEKSAETAKLMYSVGF